MKTQFNPDKRENISLIQQTIDANEAALKELISEPDFLDKADVVLVIETAIKRLKGYLKTIV